MSVAAMQNFRGVSCVTHQDEETAIREMVLKGTGLVDKHGLADAFHGMGQSESEIQQLLDSVSVNGVTPTVGPKVTVPNLRKAHDIRVLRGTVDSADEESLSDVSVFDEMDQVSSKTFRKLGSQSRQVPRCWHGAQCSWHRRGRCLFQHHEARKSLVTWEENFKAELNALWTALRKLAASLMWRTGSSLGANAAATFTATSAASTVRHPERTMEQIVDIPVPQASASQIIGSLPRLNESAAPVYDEVRQEQIAAGETTRNILEIPTVQEQVIVQGNPDVQVVAVFQEQVVETINRFRKCVANSAPSNTLCGCLFPR